MASKPWGVLKVLTGEQAENHRCGGRRAVRPVGPGDRRPRGPQPNRRTRGANVASGPAALPTDQTVSVPGIGAGRSVAEPPSPATAGSPYSVKDRPFQARKSGPGTSGGVLPGGPHFCDCDRDPAQPAGRAGCQ